MIRFLLIVSWVGFGMVFACHAEETIPKKKTAWRQYLAAKKVVGIGGKVEARDGGVESLDLSKVDLSQIDLEDLIPYHTLKTIDLTFNSSVTDETLRCLAHCQKLTEVKLKGTRITDDTLAVLGKISTLELIDLDHCDITDKGLAHLEPLPGIRYLELTNTHVTLPGASNLAKKYPALESCYWEKAPSDDVRKARRNLVSYGAIVGGHLWSLEEIVKGEREPADPSYSSSDYHILLEGLKWRNPEDGFAWVKTIADSKVISIGFANCPKGIDQHFPSILDGIVQVKHLKSLTALRGVLVEDADLSLLVGIKQLDELYINAYRLTDPGFKYLSQIDGLEYLALYLPRWSKERIELLSKAKSLKTLSVVETNPRGFEEERADALTDDLLIELARLSSLQEIELEDCNGLTPDGIKRFKALRPKVKMEIIDTTKPHEGAPAKGLTFEEYLKQDTKESNGEKDE